MCETGQSRSGIRAVQRQSLEMAGILGGGTGGGRRGPYNFLPGGQLEGVAPSNQAPKVNQATGYSVGQAPSATGAGPVQMSEASRPNSGTTSGSRRNSGTASGQNLDPLRRPRRSSVSSTTSTGVVRLTHVYVQPLLDCYCAVPLLLTFAHALAG